MVSIKQLVVLISQIAPEQAAMDFDNCGLLVGRESDKVSRVLIALDVSSAVIDEAVKNGCELIITHHPLIFKAEKKITDQSYQGDLLLKLIKNGIALYSLHTPLDAANGGCNDVLCHIFGIKNTKGIDFIKNLDGVDYYCARIGDRTASVSELVAIAKEKLGARCINIVNGNKIINKIAVCSGSGGSCVREAFDNGADCLITGELSYHDALYAKELGICVIACGHYQTEIVAMQALTSYLQDAINVLKYSVDLIKAETVTDPFDN